MAYVKLNPHRTQVFTQNVLLSFIWSILSLADEKEELLDNFVGSLFLFSLIFKRIPN